MLKMRNILIIFILLVIGGLSSIQAQTDTVRLDSNNLVTEEKQPGFGSLFKGPPGRAFLLSAVLPGAGQAYNKRWWKVPIVYAAIGTTVYILLDNKNEFDRFDDAYRMRVDLGDMSTDEFQGILSLDRINNFRQVWRKNVQRAYIGLGIIYLIQASEAFVDRHLMDFDIDDDISLDLNLKVVPGGIGIVCMF